jgi:hypothetical protein
MSSSRCQDDDWASICVSLTSLGSNHLKSRARAPFQRGQNVDGNGLLDICRREFEGFMQVGSSSRGPHSDPLFRTRQAAARGTVSTKLSEVDSRLCDVMYLDYRQGECLLSRNVLVESRAISRSMTD